MLQGHDIIELITGYVNVMRLGGSLGELRMEPTNKVCSFNNSCLGNSELRLKKKKKEKKRTQTME